MLNKLILCGMSLLFALPVLFSNHSAANSDVDAIKESTQTGDRFSAALESQLACQKKPEPAKAIGALQRAGMIERHFYLNTDSVSYFRARQPLSVWGLKVVSVFGFDFNPRIFQRGPGTAPPVTLGVVVPISERDVKAKLSSLGLQDIVIERAAELDMDSKSVKSTVLTDISCIER